MTAPGPGPHGRSAAHRTTQAIPRETRPSTKLYRSACTTSLSRARLGVLHVRAPGVLDGSAAIILGSGGGNSSGVLPVTEDPVGRTDWGRLGDGVRPGYSITSTRPRGPTRTTRPPGGG